MKDHLYSGTHNVFLHVFEFSISVKYPALSRREFSCSSESLLTIRVNLVGLIATSTVAAPSAVVWCAGTYFASTEANDEVIAS